MFKLWSWERTLEDNKRIKQQQKYWGKAIWFNSEDYDKINYRLQLNENSICNVEGSHCTKKLVTRDDTLHLRSMSHQINNDLSTDDSNMDVSCLEANDPIVQVWL